MKLRRNIERNTGNRDSEDMVAVLLDIRVTESQQVETFQGQFWARWFILTFKFNNSEVFN